MKTWLKWGLIGGGIGVILYEISKLFYKFFTIAYYFIVQTSFFLRLILGDCFGEGCFIHSLLAPLLVALEFFIIGAIVGLIIQKIKEKRK